MVCTSARGWAREASRRESVHDLLAGLSPSAPVPDGKQAHPDRPGRDQAITAGRVME